MKYSLLIFSGLFLCFQAASAQVCLRKDNTQGIYVDRAVSRTESRDDLQVAVYEKYSLKVGDDYAAFLDSIPRSEVRERKYEEQAQLFFIMEGTDCFYDSSLIVAFDKRGKVTSISWFSPV